MTLSQVICRIQTRPCPLLQVSKMDYGTSCGNLMQPQGAQIFSDCHSVIVTCACTFFFPAVNGINIIDLSKTLTQLEAACAFLAATVRKGGKVLFVGTKKQAQQCVKETAKECGQFYVTERWLGGTMTNYATIKTSIKRLKEIEKMNADGTINDYVKQEQAMIHREEARLHKYFDGISSMDKLPAAMFVVDIKREHNAVAEAIKLKIPICALVD